ncbi:flagellar biosynthesis protein FlaG [Salipaludibacillus keqinensis]|jgi:flagellar protein FlaG|uniref:Flagellar biosynthesis protein FlaG n=1 Tax=Salipaludibacillus keqinensis TaxID=2045207 RepID=A0A323TTP3_9BACI|nr:flagellar protein FlaG [Salipaludibacillus keqinensis]PYZ92815.1 flagellar biosynthesis protein FlaG [Salipaludibacillus keqinensis]
MEVRSMGSISVNDLHQQVKSERGPTQGRQSSEAQGSVDTSSRLAEHESRIQGKEWSQADLDSAMEAMNDLSPFRSTSLQFEQHEVLNRTMIKVIDQQTEEVVKEIPPKEFLDMISSMLEFAGIIIDEKV